MNHIKIPQTQFPVADIIKNRWSARSFSPKEISTEQLKTIIEAASWAPSANNAQPWEFIVAQKGTASFDKIHSCLMPGNQPWTKHAAAFIISVAKKHFEKEGNPLNPFAEHDLGLANATLLLQATTMGISGHVMAGFHQDQLKQLFNLNDLVKPMVVIALGYPDAAEKLEEPFKERELMPRSRKPVDEIIIDFSNN